MHARLTTRMSGGIAAGAGIAALVLAGCGSSGPAAKPGSHAAGGGSQASRGGSGSTGAQGGSGQHRAFAGTALFPVTVGRTWTYDTVSARSTALSPTRSCPLPRGPAATG